MSFDIMILNNLQFNPYLCECDMLKEAVGAIEWKKKG